MPDILPRVYFKHIFLLKKEQGEGSLRSDHGREKERKCSAKERLSLSLRDSRDTATYEARECYSFFTRQVKETCALNHSAQLAGTTLP